MPQLEVVPHARRDLIVCGTSVRKSAVILSAYLQSLAWQVLPPNVDCVPCFVDDGLEPDARQLLEAFVQERGGVILPSVQPGAVGDFTDIGISHQWSDQAMRRVGANKDQVIRFALENRADGLWFVDADLICDRRTLWSLLSVPAPIVCGVYWTVWSKNPPELPPVHAGPQVWLTHPYGLAGHGMEEWEFRRKLINRELVTVFGQGACTLIRRDALLKGVSFAPLPDNVGPGLMQGEDRHFCLRAERLHLRMVADPWADIWHCYHRPDDEALIPAMAARLGAEPVRTSPALGDLVALTLEAMEGIATPQGYQRIGPQQVRGRLGSLPLHPELEAALGDMARGETRIVPVHFPLSWPFPPYRGQRRLIRVVLHDHKPYGFPPVIDGEILTSERGHRWLDSTVCPPTLIEEMKEVSVAAG